MISDVSKRAICAILAADETATPLDRERVAFALRGVAPGVVTTKDAIARLSISRPTLWRLIKGGRLVGVRGAGSQNRGVTADSLERYLEGRG